MRFGFVRWLARQSAHLSAAQSPCATAELDARGPCSRSAYASQTHCGGTAKLNPSSHHWAI
jgi:hypothetical protein